MHNFEHTMLSRQGGLSISFSDFPPSLFFFFHLYCQTLQQFYETVHFFFYLDYIVLYVVAIQMGLHMYTFWKGIQIGLKKIRLNN